MAQPTPRGTHGFPGIHHCARALPNENSGADSCVTQEYHKSSWLDNALLPGCRTAMADYLKRLSVQFMCDVAPGALEPLFEADVARRQLRCKILRYPACPPATTGFVPHTDWSFLTYVRQAIIISAQVSLGKGWS
ncbi:hypothetical protein B0H15DRAFT_949801 [Mycena belliarum]|uniref:Uncharacterized protein n=1 Tax=Mycena belliarum TaxID=1033014 RepID=A0AAD6U764_9AGAR|nr:hypothetical protein B0H15DRAFT_949801 [Mycena belliae]